jgi:hypothetical protein
MTDDGGSAGNSRTKHKSMSPKYDATRLDFLLPWPELTCALPQQPWLLQDVQARVSLDVMLHLPEWWSPTILVILLVHKDVGEDMAVATQPKWTLCSIFTRLFMKHLSMQWHLATPKNVEALEQFRRVCAFSISLILHCKTQTHHNNCSKAARWYKLSTLC